MKCLDLTETQPKPLSLEENNKNKRPLIGILAERRKVHDGDFGMKSINSVNTSYVEAVEKAGGIPVILPYVQEPKTLLPLLETLNGLVIPGGSDIDPHLYGESPSVEMGPMDPVLDRHLYLMVEYAIRSRLPILGICKGLQLVNIVMCGTLYQDLSHRGEPSISHNQLVDKRLIHHGVDLVPGSTLHKIFGREQIMVNSYHHQSIKDLAPGLEVVGTSEDGVIEAVEGNFMPFIGVQWHPEELLRGGDRDMARLFKYFIAMTRDNLNPNG